MGFRKNYRPTIVEKEVVIIVSGYGGYVAALRLCERFRFWKWD